MNKDFKIKLISFLVIITFLLLFSFSKGFSAGNKVLSGEVEVVFNDKDVYVPSRIVIKKGTTVKFVNKSGHDFWPASDFYPQNTNYDGFDPKIFLKDGETWKFKFDDVGTWGYHDNLKPIVKGVIIVVENGKIYMPIKKVCGELKEVSYTQRQLCWYGLIEEAVKKGGVGKALSLFDELYNNEPLFSQGCHDAMHLIGDAAYREYRKGSKFVFTNETSFCGYGFYHGFIEAMLYTTGDYTEVRNFCESTSQNLKVDIESPNTIYSCYHGIGHATFDAHNPNIWGDEVKMVGPAISTCEKVTVGYAEEKTKQCVTGVFNALGIAYSNNLYKFTMNKKDPVWYCRTLKTLYKKACFIEVTMAWITNQMGNYDYKFKDAIVYVEQLNDFEGEKAAIFSVSSDYARLHLNDLNNHDLILLCKAVKTGLYAPCLEGLQLAVLNWGKPGQEYDRALSFCGDNLFTEKEKESCYRYMFNSFATLYSKEKRLNICNQNVPGDFKEKCIGN